MLVIKPRQDTILVCSRERHILVYYTPFLLSSTLVQSQPVTEFATTLTYHSFDANLGEKTADFSYL